VTRDIDKIYRWERWSIYICVC